MSKLYDLVVRDKYLQRLIHRINRNEAERYQSNVVVVAGYDARKPRQREALKFEDYDKFKSHFGKEQKQEFNGRIVAHVLGTATYVCLTDIVDKHRKKGYWMILGKRKNKHVKRMFRTRSDLEKKMGDIIKKMKGRVIVHKIGTTTYNIIDVKKYESQQLLEPR